MDTTSGIKTPYYLYDLDLLRQTLEEARQAAGRYDYHIHYAIKANHNPIVTGIINDYGFGVDCVSGNEVMEALHRGFPAEKIVYAGVGKSDDEIRQALENDIFCFNVESLEELQVIDEIASEMKKTARIALRVNPGVQAHTHKYITTGLDENKFGIHPSQMQEALDLCRTSQRLDFRGLHFHIGSQITSLQPFAELCNRVNEIWKEFDISSMGATIVNLGGGLGVNYEDPEGNPVPDFQSFFDVIAENLRIPQHIQVHFELGRSLVAQCGSLITRVMYTKKGVDKEFVITDAGMTELMRPSLYQAKHKIENTSNAGETFLYDVVGPVCESSDVFGKAVELPVTRRGHILAIKSCGAYAESMMLRYNMRARARSYFLDSGEFAKYDFLEKDLRNVV
ncbi:MAG: diaminopimelate decarboxylase [Bacteroidales bacterium]|nr:diaminopimelate decarboxylase [Bacteroidales bacterium]